MKLKQLLINKKFKIVLFVFLFALIVVIAILVTHNSKEVEDKESMNDIVVEDAEDKTTENSEVMDDSREEGNGLEILKPNEVDAKNSSDASGDWEVTEESNAQIDDKITTDQTDDTPLSDEQNQDNKEDNGTDILEDDVEWGGIY